MLGVRCDVDIFKLTPVSPFIWTSMAKGFRKSFLITHKFGTACAIEMIADREDWSECYNSNRARSGTSVIRRPRVAPPAWVGLTTNWSPPDRVSKSNAATPWRFVVVEQNHSWWCPFKLHTNMKEARTFSAFTAAEAINGQLLIIVYSKKFSRLD